jgi:hypothetical protein
MVDGRGQWLRNESLVLVDQFGRKLIVIVMVLVVETHDANVRGVYGRVLVGHERGHRRVVEPGGIRGVVMHAGASGWSSETVTKGAAA